MGSHVGRMPPTRWPTMARMPLYTSKSSTRSWQAERRGRTVGPKVPSPPPPPRPWAKRVTALSLAG